MRSTVLSRATFTGGSTNQYKNWLKLVTPDRTSSYATYVGARVQQEDEAGRIYFGNVQSITQGLKASETRIPATDANYPTESRPFSIVWHDDDTDSAVSFADLQELLVSSNATAQHSSTSGPGSRRPSGGAPAVRHAPPPLNPPQPAPAPPDLHIFTGLPTSAGDIVDILTRNGSFAYIESLHNSDDLFNLLNYRINRLPCTGDVLNRYAECHKLILTLTVRFPERSLARRLLACFTRSLPSLLLPASRRGRPQQALRNCTRFLQGDWKGLWQSALKWAKKEHDRVVARAASGKTERKARSTEARVKYALHCHKRGALSKANKAMTSDLAINNDPANLPALKKLHPEPTHADRDPTEYPNRHWAETHHKVLDWLDTEEGREWVEKAFDLDKVKRYFRTRSPVGMADPDGCKARDMVARLLDGDDDHTHTHSCVTFLSCLTLPAILTTPT